MNTARDKDDIESAPLYASSRGDLANRKGFGSARRRHKEENGPFDEMEGGSHSIPSDEECDTLLGGTPNNNNNNSNSNNNNTNKNQRVHYKRSTAIHGNSKGKSCCASFIVACIISSVIVGIIMSMKKPPGIDSSSSEEENHLENSLADHNMGSSKGGGSAEKHYTTRDSNTNILNHDVVPSSTTNNNNNNNNYNNKYNIQWYDRGSGWLGQSYMEALDFCDEFTDAQNIGLRPCSYETICPNGVGSEPTNGFRNNGEGNNNGIWVPTGDQDNTWARVSEGPGESCVADRPDWGMRKEGNEEYTRFVACCSVSASDSTGIMGKNDTKAATLLAPSDDAKQADSQQDVVQPAPDDAQPATNAQPADDKPVDAQSPPTENKPVDAKPADAQPTPSEDKPANEQPADTQPAPADKQPLDAQPANAQPTPTDDKPTNNEQTSDAQPAPAVDQPSDAQPANGQTAETESAPSNAEINAISINWYGRGTGWLGQSYPEALEFCNAQTPGFRPCSYDTICPNGIDSEPKHGYRVGGENGAYVPTGDKDNSWVRISAEPGPSCITSEPSWGLVKEGSEVITRFIACCPATADTGTTADVNAPANSQPADAKSIDAKPSNSQPADAQSANDQPADVKSNAAQPANAEPDDSNPASAATSTPIHWYGRNTGWLGDSYPEAVEFCGEKTAGHRPCLYDTICPNGIDSEPTDGYRSGGVNGIWVPIGDKDNNWVRVSEQPGQSCITSEPSWGTTKGGSDPFTLFVACCSATMDTGAIADTKAPANSKPADSRTL